jgi:hypothetical protein
MSAISKVIANKRNFYMRSLKTTSEWSSKRSSMNGTSDRFIRNMLQQILKELSIPTTSATSIINAIFTRDFDATKIVNRVSDYSRNRFDILSKDIELRELSINAALHGLELCKISISSYNSIQLAGLCVFVQFILAGGRSDYQGFGCATNLIDKWKKIERENKVKEQQRKAAENQAKMEEMIKKSIESSTEDKPEVTEKITPISEEIPTSWEDL